ncbi:hypothetical protein WA577_004860, partial [Blastocystis sp. JDR]
MSVGDEGSHDSQSTTGASCDPIRKYSYEHHANSSSCDYETPRLILSNNTSQSSSPSCDSQNDCSFQYGVVDYIGVCGRKEDDLSLSSFPLPFSSSFKSEPLLRSCSSKRGKEEDMPNALEWFCFPDGIHLHRPLPPLIMRFIPTPLLVGIEFIIPSLPCDSLC